jgi:hypothetical protein
MKSSIDKHSSFASIATIGGDVSGASQILLSMMLGQ